MRQLLCRRLKSLDLKELRSIMRVSSYFFQMAASTARRSMVRRARSSAENSDFCAAAGAVVFAAAAGVGDWCARASSDRSTAPAEHDCSCHSHRQISMTGKNASLASVTAEPVDISVSHMSTSSCRRQSVRQCSRTCASASCVSKMSPRRGRIEGTRLDGSERSGAT